MVLMHIYPIAIPVICKMWIVRHTVYSFFGKGVDGLAVTCNGRIDFQLGNSNQTASIRLTFTILLSYNSKLNRLRTHCISQRLGRLGDFWWRSSNTDQGRRSLHYFLTLAYRQLPRLLSFYREGNGVVELTASVLSETTVADKR
jgi:hypothetical protein